MKEKRIIIALVSVLVIGVLMFIGCKIFRSGEEPHPDALRFKAEYERYNGELRDNGEPHFVMDISENNMVRYMYFEGFQELFSSGTGIFFFGLAACPSCRPAFPIFLEEAYERGINVYYFYDLRTHREGETPQLAYMMERLHDYLPVNDRDQNPDDPDFDPEWKRISVPHYFVVRDGEVIFHLMMNRHPLVIERDFDGLREYFTKLFDHLTE